MYNHQLKAFVTAADCRSLSKAAEKLFISTPALIQQINLLERDIGVTLFVRSHSGVTLTRPGESLYRDALKLIQLSDEARLRAVKAADAANRTIRVGIIYSGVCTILNSVMPAVRKQLPGIKVEYVPLADNGANLAGSFDIMECIWLNNLEAVNCKFKRFSDTVISLGIPPAHPLAGRESLTVRDLDGCTILLPANNMSYLVDGVEKELKQAGSTARIIVEPMPIPSGITRCLEDNCLLLITEHYNETVMNLNMTPLKTEFVIPYGLIYRDDPQKPMIYHFVSAAAEIYSAGR